MDNPACLKSLTPTASAKDELQPTSADAAGGCPDGLGQTGESPDELVALRNENARLRDRNQELETKTVELQRELANLNLDKGLEMEAADALDAPGTEAVRKRLARLCAPRADGKHGLKGFTVLIGYLQLAGFRLIQ